MSNHMLTEPPEAVWRVCVEAEQEITEFFLNLPEDLVPYALAELQMIRWEMLSSRTVRLGRNLYYTFPTLSDVHVIYALNTTPACKIFTMLAAFLEPDRAEAMIRLAKDRLRRSSEPRRRYGGRK